MVAGDAPDVGHDGFAGDAEVYGVQPPVAWVAPAFQETPLLQAIDEGDEARGRGAELLSQGLLAAAGSERDRSQQAGLGWGQVELSDPLGERLRGVGAELGQQEGAAACGQRAVGLGWTHERNDTA